MTLRICLIGIALGVFGLACASAQRTRTAGTQLASGDPAAKGGMALAKDDHRKVICQYEILVGSHIPEKTCRLEEDVDSTRQATQDTLRRIEVPTNVRTGY